MENIRKSITDIILARQKDKKYYINLGFTVNGNTYEGIFNASAWDGCTYVVVNNESIDIDDIPEDALETIYKKIL